MAITDFVKKFSGVTEFIAGIIEKLKEKFEKKIWVKYIYTYTFVATRHVEGRVIYKNKETGEAYKRPLTPIEKEIIKRWEEKGVLVKEKERIERKLEGRIVSYVPIDYVGDEEFEEKIQEVFKEYVYSRNVAVKKKGRGDYGFIFEQPNMVANPHSWRYEEDTPLSEREMIIDCYNEFGVEVPHGKTVFFIELYDHTYNRNLFSDIFVIRDDYYLLSVDEILSLLGV